MSNKAQDPKKTVATVEEPTTEADKIWEEIKDRNIEMFALPSQTVSEHCTQVKIGDPNKLYLVLRSTSTLPSLEMSCGSDFVVELADKFAVVSRAPKPLTVPKK